jgi:hypothetical protein
MAGFLDRFGPLTRRLSVSKSLQDLSSFGMKYDDMIIRNSQAIGIMEDKVGFGQMNPMGYDNEDYWYPFAALSMADTTLRKSISFFDQDYVKKRDELRNFALQDEVEEILDTLCDESIVYDTKNFFCQPDVMLLTNIKDDVKKELTKSFNHIYNYFGFNQDQSAWFYYRKWLIDGYLSFEIIYNDRQDEIIGFKEIDPVTLVPGIDRTTNKKIWYQYKDNPAKERKIFDSQIIYISYGSVSTASRISYVERLVRAFNLMRIMETTRVIWAVMNSSYRLKFIIPVGGKSKTRAKQSLAQLMNNYREVVDFDYHSGTLKVDGKPMMAFNKEYWLPSKEGEQPEIETLGADGPDFNDTDSLKYFADKLKMASKIPFSRFDKDSPATYEMSAEGLIREEIKFEKFVNRLRSTFQELLVKPLYIQMCLKFPHLKNDVNFKTQISLVFNADNMFAELKEMEIFQKRIDFISSMKDSITTQDKDMNDVPYFDLQFLVERFLKMDPADLEKNKEMIEAKEKEKKKAEKEGGGESAGGVDLGF